MEHSHLDRTGMGVGEQQHDPRFLSWGFGYQSLRSECDFAILAIPGIQLLTVKVFLQRAPGPILDFRIGLTKFISRPEMDRVKHFHFLHPVSESQLKA